MNLTIPSSLRTEHNELHAELARATKVGGRVATTALSVARTLHPHFLREEEFALPPLALLSDLAQGRATAEMRDVLKLTDRLKAELPQMLAEHKAVVAELAGLVEAARREGRPEFTHFAERLILHATNEEQVLYPAAILAGEYLRLRLETAS